MLYHGEYISCLREVGGVMILMSWLSIFKVHDSAEFWFKHLFFHAIVRLSHLYCWFYATTTVTYIFKFSFEKIVFNK